jgi:hypothetical protein
MARKNTLEHRRQKAQNLTVPRIATILNGNSSIPLEYMLPVAMVAMDVLP